jgi:hypothetical protein
MATFTSAAAFVRHIGQYGERIAVAEDKALKAAALAAVTDIRAEAAPFHIRGRSGKKIPLKAGYEILGSSAVITARPGGAWQIIEEGAGPHIIGPRRKRGRGRGRGRRAAVAVPGLGIFAYVRHPGTGGSIGKPWAKGSAKAKRSAPTAYFETVRRAMR